MIQLTHGLSLSYGDCCLFTAKNIRYMITGSSDYSRLTLIKVAMRIRERNNESYITHNENINYNVNQTYL